MLKFFTKKEYQEIANLYSLGKIRSIKIFKKGYQTPKAVVEVSKGEFIIAKHNLSKKRTVVPDMKIVPKVALLHEINLLNYLKSLPVPKYVKSIHGKYLEDFKKYSVSVYKFIKGHQPRVITPPMAYQLGMFVAKFHQLGKRFKKPFHGRRRFYDLNPQVLDRMHRYAKGQTHPELKRAVEEIRSGVIRTTLPKGLPKGPIHVDIKPDNELFLNGKLKGIIDFGNTYIDSFLLDVGKTIMWNCVRGRKLDSKLINSFLAGYQSRRKLSPEELKYLNQSILFAIYSHIWVDLYHVPIRYVPQSYTLFLVRKFLPIARRLESNPINV